MRPLPESFEDILRGGLDIPNSFRYGLSDSSNLFVLVKDLGEGEYSQYAGQQIRGTDQFFKPLTAMFLSTSTPRRWGYLAGAIFCIFGSWSCVRWVRITNSQSLLLIVFALSPLLGFSGLLLIACASLSG